MKVLIHNDMELWDFMIEGLKSRNDFIDIPLNRYCNIFQWACRKKLWKLHLPACFLLGGKLRNILRSLKPGDEVIASAYTQPALFHAIVNTVGEGVSVHLWMWNPVKNNTHFSYGIKEIKKFGVICHSFDKEDCKKYGMQFHNTFYNMHTTADEQAIDTDFYFLGDAKDRGEVILQTKELLSPYITNFVMPSHPSEYITYANNIRNIMRSRCIVEILQQQQHDITLRPLEALTFRKKLLTNNPAIVDYPFYNPQNIFVIGKDDLNTISTFLHSSYVDVDENIVEKFDVNTWFNNI